MCIRDSTTYTLAEASQRLLNQTLPKPQALRCEYVLKNLSLAQMHRYVPFKQCTTVYHAVSETIQPLVAITFYATKTRI